MYPVAANFHTLAIQDAPKTRVRIYFIGDGVDCTDDNDVQTNGTLLVGAVGDTDSNGRISESGITFNEFFNPEKNIMVGDCVSSQISMTLLNYDGALDGFAFGRCKVYLDVYDDTNSAWLPCPMGVYIIEQPIKTKQSLISVHGFDQMQRLDVMADSWWSALDWTNGLTPYDLVASMAAEIGVSVSSTTQNLMDNANAVPFHTPPTDCRNATYRSVLGLIAEGCGLSARFDRDGALDLRWFNMSLVFPNVINTDTVGNRCFSISISEQTVAKYGTLLYRVTSDDDYAPITLPGDNTYRIDGNPFVNPNNMDLINFYGASFRNNVLVKILHRLRTIDTYKPINGRFIMDWSLESGDRIFIKNNGTTYSFPMFQQTMTWRGGYVVSETFSDGDSIRPESDYRANDDFETYSEKSRVTDAEINTTGWYRAIQYGAVSVPASKGYYGVVFNIGITREGTAENHTIQYLSSADYDSNASLWVAKGFFANESSNGQNSYTPACVDKIRYVYDYTANDNGWNSAYIDIHVQYRAGGNNRIHFQFDCDMREVDKSLAVAAGLTPVADTPANQVIQSVYSFSPVAINKTQKVATATLSSAGWYRVMKIDAASTASVEGGLGAIVNFNITRQQGHSTNEVHGITLDFVRSPALAFVNENSKSGTLLIDKIRYNTAGTVGYIDIHYTGTAAEIVVVCFDVNTTPIHFSSFTAESLQSVADSPAGETVLTTHTFAANTNGDVTSSYSITKSTGRLLTLDSAYRYGKVVHMQITAASSSAVSEGSNIATGTLNGAKPSVRVLNAAYYDNRIAIIMINTDGAITVRLSKGNMESSYTVTFGFTFICS